MESNQPNPAFYHAPIMVEEVLSLLQPARGGVFVDGTLGGGG
ncbi:MAG: 16S rRNA (cytosine(1402)-N(4))-methyltransferase, partial [Clostridia bacterium]|nr:16S rRNA (cytosine(1402)-N(4))-methyltransferase [Clostridia bacterium]